MDSSAFFLLIPGSTATTGAWPSPLSRGGWLGVQQRDDGSPRAVPRNGSFAGEKRPGPGSAPFGGRNGLVCLFSRCEKCCHNGGLRRHVWIGDDNRALAPHPGRREPHG